MDSIKQAATQFILTPEYHDILSIVKGFRNGLVYGAKIRFPHALVMTLLFRRSNFKDMSHFVLKATRQHARNLAFFATIYKTLLIVQRRMHGKERPLDSFLAGLVGGYMVFGENNNVNQQIVLYLFSRIMMGLAKLPVKKNVIAEPTQTFPIFASLVWATVMFLFQNERDVLQPSLQASMQYIYIDSNRWNTLKNFLWHNK
ncbi:peroxisomal membrane protein 4 [Entomortierella parvispora]|uniref:Peroxisomal membrane protein 4 n=1 Tax=Entomortierella parvispora TaxID=205924 RepID=A0A9P3LTF0_9FUNG|nr:peroxisomal membrane protein 4 [Entomortierella parvispora]